MSHTADLMIEAWGLTRLACFEEAVRALVETFADTSDAATDEPVRISIEPASDEEMLVSLLEEVIYVVDVFGRVPVHVTLEETEDGGLDGAFDVARVEAVGPAGAVPKAVARHALSFAHEGERWLARATIDV